MIVKIQSYNEYKNLKIKVNMNLNAYRYNIRYY